MMYPKPQRKKKRKKHKASILHCKDGTCYLCMKLKGDYRRYPVVHEHHIYDGPNRQNSEAEGLKVYLCLDHHIMGPGAVHNNHKNMRILHRDGQRASAGDSRGNPVRRRTRQRPTTVYLPAGQQGRGTR